MIEKGLAAVEDLIATNRDARYCIGSHPSIADCCLVPQLYNARRYECDMTKFPRGARPSRRAHGSIPGATHATPAWPSQPYTVLSRAASRISAPSRPHLGPISAVSRAALAVEAHVSTLKPFADAHPDTQPDAKK